MREGKEDKKLKLKWEKDKGRKRQKNGKEEKDRRPPILGRHIDEGFLFMISLSPHNSPRKEVSSLCLFLRCGK